MSADSAAALGALLFWVAFALSAFTYFGYPALVGLLSLLFGRAHRPAPPAAGYEPSVTMLVPAHNEAVVIGAKIANCLGLDYPKRKLQIRIVSDGSVDGTDAIVEAHGAAGIELQRIEPRGGKPNAINRALPHARGDILVLSDANTMLHADALRRLVRHFHDLSVGAVTGDVRLESDTVAYGAGEGLLFRLERFLQRHEGRLWTAIGVDGGLYAVRRTLFRPNRPDTLVDDFVTAMNVAKQGARVVIDPSAVAVEDAVADPAQELRRRVRTCAGGFQSLCEGLGRPTLGQPLLLAAYFFHKGLRWLSPFVLMLMLLGNVLAVLDGDRLYALLLGLHLMFYALALAGMALQERALPTLVCLPYYFALTNLAALRGFLRWARHAQPVTWAQADRAIATSK
jgi:biofilm PGA synthesis N-glycosyltransferase PgaC